MHPVTLEAQKKILILDGAMATMIQPLGLTEADFRNRALAGHETELKGNNDLLNLTRPDVIMDIHLAYIKAGSDILSTNTFGANRISQEDYHTAAQVFEMNYAGARIARKAIREYRLKGGERPIFVAGSMGPTTKLASLSPEVNNPGFRSVTFDQLAAAYTEQAKALIAGGIDLFLLETITDTLNAKAALYALMHIFRETGKRYPIMVSGTITDASGRILSGQTIEAFIISISHAPILSIGLNCALGARELRPHIETLDRECPFMVSAHPNAGLPNQFGGYDQSANEFAAQVSEFAANGWINIAGGCCGTTPDHIAAMAAAVQDCAPRKQPTAMTDERTAITNYATAKMVSNWLNGTEGQYPLRTALDMIARINDKTTLNAALARLNERGDYYHPQQTLLLKANISGRRSYLVMN